MASTLAASNGVIVLYPKSNLISFDGRLFRAATYVMAITVGFKSNATQPNAIVIHPHDRFSLLISSSQPTDTYDSIIVACTTDDATVSKKDKFIDTINRKWRRIQRWMRTKARKLIADKKLALAMALHARLGNRCCMAVLNLDCIRFVAELLNGAQSHA
jgi:hypothetical protein